MADFLFQPRKPDITDEQGERGSKVPKPALTLCQISTVVVTVTVHNTVVTILGYPVMVGNRTP
jgi:hypothetical protein